MLPLAEGMRKAIPESLQPWFAHNSSSGGKAIHNAACLNYLLEHGPRYGYFPSPSKSWYICKEIDEPAAIDAFAQFNLPIKMTRGHAYLGGFIGNAATKDEWLNEKNHYLDRCGRDPVQNSYPMVPNSLCRLHLLPTK